MTTRLAIRAALQCLFLVGCGGSESPAQRQRDSAVSPAVPAELLVALSPETTRGGVPVGTSSVAVARETVPTIVTKAFAKAVSVQHRSRPFPHQVIRDSAARVLGYEAFSDSAGVTRTGYAGAVPVQVFFDSRGKPVRIYILENCETPAYLDLVYQAGLLDTLLSYNPAKPDSVDAVTLATPSSRAIIAGVTGLAARVSAELLAKPSPGSR